MDEKKINERIHGLRNSIPNMESDLCYEITILTPPIDSSAHILMGLNHSSTTRHEREKENHSLILTE